MSSSLVLDKRLNLCRSEWTEGTVQSDNCCIDVICKHGQISVCPDVGTTSDLLPQQSPLLTEVCSLRLENYPVIRPPFVVDIPGFLWRENILAHDVSIGEEAEEPQLADTAEGHRVPVYTL